MRSRLVLLALAGAAVISLDVWAQVGRPESGDVGPLAVVALGCAPDQIEMTPTHRSDDDVLVSGCGKTARYVWTWHSGWRGGVANPGP